MNHNNTMETTYKIITLYLETRTCETSFTLEHVLWVPKTHDSLDNTLHTDKHNSYILQTIIINKQMNKY